MSIDEFVAEKLKSGTYKLMNNEKGTSTMWSIFSLIAKENGSVLDGFVYCRQCKSLVKYSRKATYNAYRHKCFLDLKKGSQLNNDADETQYDSMIEENDPIAATEKTNIGDNEKDLMEEECSLDDSKQTHREIKFRKHVAIQIQKGVYKLKDRLGRKSLVWSYFKIITKEDGSTLNGLVWCPHCEKLLSNQSSSNLLRHKCILKSKQQDGQLPIKRAKVEDTNNVIFQGSNEDLIFLSETEDSFLEEKLEPIVKNDPQIDDDDDDDEEEEEEEEYVTSESEFFSVVKVENENITAENITWEEGHSPNPNDEEKNSLYKSSEFEKNIKSGVYSLVRKSNAKSLIWSVFDLIVKEDGSVAEGYVSCRSCKRLMKYNGTSTSNLNRHKCYKVFLKTAKQEKVNQDHKKEAINVCYSWVVQDCLPCNMIEGEGFRKMLKFFIKLGAAYGENIDIVDLLPDSNTIAERIKTLAEENKSRIKSQFERSYNDISVTVDLWPDYYLKKQILSATLHFQKSYELSNIKLGLKTVAMQTRAPDVRNKIERLLNEFGVSCMKNIVFVTDAQSELTEALSSWTSMVCSNYLFTKVVDTALERTDELSGVIADYKSIVQYFKTNHIQTNITATFPFQCSSNYILIKSVTDNWQQVQNVLNESTPQLLTKKESATVKTVVQLFQKFEVIFKKLQGIRSPSLCFVIPSINCIKAFCEYRENDDPAVAAFKSNILKCLEEIWLPNITIWHKAAFFLYPPANKEQTNDLNEIQDFCIQQINELEKNVPRHEKATNLNSDTSSSATPSKVTENAESDNNNFNEDVSFFFPTLVRKSLQTIPKSPAEEITRYSIDHVMIDETFNVIQWWQENSTNYPRLSKLAIRILSIPASNTSTQRPVALSGNIVSEKHNKFSPKTMDNILFLNSIQEKAS